MIFACVNDFCLCQQVLSYLIANTTCQLITIEREKNNERAQQRTDYPQR